ncbi:MAG: response regulator [Rhodospirillales bacterium]|nr:response regulator [Rhodospirillaceae bacterium]MBT7485035.1 response regulator [Rhodospirillales bacterium]MBT8002662.1 response regulator [Rhodospirillales bacterium]
MSNLSEIQILYIEDSAPQRELVKLTIKKNFGLPVDTADTGAEGIELWASGSYNILIVDYNLPDMTGIEICQQVLSKQPNTSILMVTAEGNEDVAIEALNLGVTNYINKGSDKNFIKLLPAVIRRLADRVVELREKKNTEIALRESEKNAKRERDRLQDVIEGITVGFVVYDENDQLVMCNKSYFNTSDDIQDIIIPGVYFEEIVRTRAERNKNKGGILRDEAWIQKRLADHRNPRAPFERTYDGRTYHVHEFKTATGSITLFRIDITDIKKTEHELRQSQERLTNAIESLNSGFAYFDADDRLYIANKTFVETRPGVAHLAKPGITYEEFIKAQDPLALTIGDGERDEAWYEMRMKQHRNPSGPLYRQLKDGRHIQIDEVKTNDGGTINVRTDITNLINAKAEAEAANQSKMQFLAAASHDVRQPLQALGMFGSALRDKLLATSVGDDETIQKLVGHMDNSISVLNGMFDSLLEISKLDAQTLEPEILEFDLNELILQLLGRFEPTATAKNLSLESQPSEFRVRCDKILLDQILSNLLSNAIRYTESGKVELVVDQQGDQIVVAVADTGIGIPKDKIDHIFDEFYQVGNEHRDRTKGFGLGLSIVKRTADLLELPLTVESKEGQGSIFTLQIPLANGKQAIKALPDKREDARALKIMVIDDDSIVLESLKFRLEAWNHTTLAALSLEQARGLLSESNIQPDIIISDLRLSDTTDGVQAIEALRSQLRERVPGIILTGDTSAERLRYIENAGLPILHKPVNSDTLAEKLHEICG